MGQLRENLDDLEENGQLGDWCFTECDYHGEHVTLMFLRHPVSDEIRKKFYQDDPDMDRGDFCSLPLSGSGKTFPVWQWDGNREAPTLSPSINVIGRWHGFLRAGKLETV
jgi:hypothetical protein